MTNKTTVAKRPASSRPEKNIMVVATMSAGKSSLINALLGTDILWSGNEAATATITRIHTTEHQQQHMQGRCFNENGDCQNETDNMTRDLFRQWNNDPQITLIELTGQIAAFASSEHQPVIYDTPGPNNTQDSQHKKLLQKALKEYKNGLIIYVLNATQPSVDDDANLLAELKQHLAKTLNKRIIFVLNKIDNLDEEKGETFANAVATTKHYLEKMGFKDPIIIPAMMKAALVAKKWLGGDSITLSEKIHLRQGLNAFLENKHTLNNAALIPDDIREKVHKALQQQLPATAEPANSDDEFNEHKLRQFTAFSGLLTVERYIDHYLSEASKPKESRECMDIKEVNLYVISPTSSGKSTLINAILGQELLPAGNEATTANIIRITDDKTLECCFKAQCVGKNHSKGREFIATTDRLNDWNQLSDIQQIDLRGNIINMKERNNAIITEIPGINNHHGKEYESVTMDYIQHSTGNSLILYILNSTEFSTDDDKVLRLIAKKIKTGGKQHKDRFIFIVSKIDTLDPKNVCISSTLCRVKNYLRYTGIQNPEVYPVSAYLALLCRKQPNTLSTSQNADYRRLKKLFNKKPGNVNLLDYISVDSPVHERLKNRALNPIIECSGLPALEIIIEKYINEYILPPVKYEKRVHQIYIEHNPITVETLFRINGEEPDEDSELNNYKIMIIQTWVEDIFIELTHIFSGEAEFDVEFKGIEYDFQDLKKAAEIATDNGMHINLTHIPMEEADELLSVISKAKQHPRFNEYIYNYFNENYDSNVGDEDDSDYNDGDHDDHEDNNDYKEDEDYDDHDDEEEDDDEDYDDDDDDEEDDEEDYDDDDDDDDDEEEDNDEDYDEEEDDNNR